MKTKSSAWLFAAALSVLMAGCIPIGTEPIKTEIAWAADNCRIERREIHDKVIVPVSVEGVLQRTYFIRHEYWLFEGASKTRLPHVQESSDLRPDGTRDRYYLGKVMGDAVIGKWFLVAHRITSRSRADVFLIQFDRRAVLRTIVLPDCRRNYTFKYTSAEHFSLQYDPVLKAVRFHSDSAVGVVDLRSGDVKSEAAQIPEPTPAGAAPR